MHFLLLCGRLFVLHFLWKFLWTWPLVSIWPFVVVVIVVGGKHNVVIPRTLPAFFHNFFYLSFCTQTWQRCISTQFHKWQALAFQNFLCINRGKQASCQAYNIHILAHICIVHTYQRLFGIYFGFTRKQLTWKYFTENYRFNTCPLLSVNIVQEEANPCVTN